MSTARPRVDVFIIVEASHFPPTPVGGIWYRSYEAAKARAEEIDSQFSAYQIQKWSVPPAHYNGGDPCPDVLRKLGVGQ